MDERDTSRLGKGNHARMQLLSLATLAATSVGAFFFYDSVLDENWYTAGFVGHKAKGLNAAIATLFSVFFFVLCKKYLQLWGATTDLVNLRVCYERFIVPAASITFPLGFDYIHAYDWRDFGVESFILGILLFILLNDPRGVIKNYLRDTSLGSKYQAGIIRSVAEIGAPLLAVHAMYAFVWIF